MVQGVHVCLNLDLLTTPMITASMCKGAKAYIRWRTGASETFWSRQMAEAVTREGDMW